MCGFIAQLVEHRTGIAEVAGSNPVEALIFFRLLLYNSLSWKMYCDDHSSLSSIACVAGRRAREGKGGIGFGGEEEGTACKDAIVFFVFHVHQTNVKILIGQI